MVATAESFSERETQLRLPILQSLPKTRLAQAMHKRILVGPGVQVSGSGLDNQSTEDDNDPITFAVWLDQYLNLSEIDRVVIFQRLYWMINAERAAGHGEGLAFMQAERRKFDEEISYLKQRFDFLERRNEQQQLLMDTFLTHFEQAMWDMHETGSRDPKTHLMDFDRFKKLIDAYLRGSLREGMCLLAMFDLASMRMLNREIGEVTVDRIIGIIAKLLKKRVAQFDNDPEGEHRRALCCRFGGDEFCLLIPQLKSDFFVGSDLNPDCIAGLVLGGLFEDIRNYPWAEIDPRLKAQVIYPYVGAVLFAMGPQNERLSQADLTDQLLRSANKAMSMSKERVKYTGIVESGTTHFILRLRGGVLQPV